MTTKKIKTSDILGNNYYIYELRSSNYTPALNGTITITCTVTDVYGDPINNKSITLYKNGTSISTQTTNSSGVATWSITCSTAGLQSFSIKDTSIEVFVDNKENTSNKVTSLSSSSTDTQYPSAKTVYDSLNNLNTSNIKIAGEPLTNIWTGATITSQATLNTFINDHIGEIDARLQKEEIVYGSIYKTDSSKVYISGVYNKVCNINSQHPFLNEMILFKLPNDLDSSSTKLIRIKVIYYTTSYASSQNSVEFPAKYNNTAITENTFASNTIILLKLNSSSNGFDVVGVFSPNSTGSYIDLTDKPTIPSKTSDLTNDSNFLTSHQTLKTINNESIIGTGNIEISVGENYGTFSELQTIINNAQNNDTIILEKDYQCQNGEDPIQVYNYININGNGHIIDGNNMSNIGMYGGNLYNVKFINCHSDYNGGAVYSFGTMKIDNCLFMNNTSGGSGGALDFESDDSVVTNCVFINNKSQSNGGVLYSECEGYKFINCIFSNNSSDYDGGALWVAPYDEDNVTIKDCIFVDNTANGNGGGIYAYTHEEIKVYNCTFIESSLYNTRNVNYIAEDQPLISGKEDSSNKVSSWSSTPTDAHYPSEKLVKDYVDGLIGNAITYINQ